MLRREGVDVIGAFPGTFNPPTVAHLAIAEAAWRTYGLDRVDLILSRVPLGKDVPARPTLDERIAVLRRIGARLPWLAVDVTDARLIADIVEGYDVVVMGADKWHQVHDASFYDDSDAARDAAVARLPAIAVVPRSGHHSPTDITLDVDPTHLGASSTLARSGRHDLMAPEAVESGLWTP